MQSSHGGFLTYAIYIKQKTHTADFIVLSESRKCKTKKSDGV